MQLGHCLGLRSMSLSNLLLADTAGLAKLTALTQLSLQDCFSREPLLVEVDDNQQVWRWGHPFSVGLPELQGLRKLVGLVALQLVMEDAAGWQVLAGLTQLRRLHVGSISATSTAVQPSLTAVQPSLTELQLDGPLQLRQQEEQALGPAGPQGDAALLLPGLQDWCCSATTPVTPVAMRCWHRCGATPRQQSCSWNSTTSVQMAAAEPTCAACPSCQRQACWASSAATQMRC
jgi:hypothetical protein